jgi:hypothetical protein
MVDSLAIVLLSVSSFGLISVHTIADTFCTGDQPPLLHSLAHCTRLVIPWQVLQLT